MDRPATPSVEEDEAPSVVVKIEPKEGAKASGPRRSARHQPPESVDSDVMMVDPPRAVEPGECGFFESETLADMGKTAQPQREVPRFDVDFYAREVDAAERAEPTINRLEFGDQVEIRALRAERRMLEARRRAIDLQLAALTLREAEIVGEYSESSGSEDEEAASESSEDEQHAPAARGSASSIRRVVDSDDEVAGALSVSRGPPMSQVEGSGEEVSSDGLDSAPEVAPRPSKGKVSLKPHRLEAYRANSAQQAKARGAKKAPSKR